MNKKIGFIGCGNMAQAMIGGIIKSNLVSAEEVFVSNPSKGKLDKVNSAYGVKTTLDNMEVAKFADILFLCIKPNKYQDVISQIKDIVKKDVIIVSIAAGINLQFVEKSFERDLKVVRAMPNTPALVGEAMSALCDNKMVVEDDLDFIVKIFESFGEVEVVKEDLIDVITGISGSSPAYTYLFIESLADAGVLRGLPRDKAYKFAAQAVLGSAKMVIDTKQHPGVLKDNVCSPGGTTIEAIYDLEKNNFRGTVISAVDKCINKSIDMNKSNK